MAAHRVRFRVVGRVQGVGFRAYARQEARRLGLAGFVQNNHDGSVAGEAEGAPELVAAFVQWLRQGPPWGRVEDVEVEEVAANGEDREFEVRR